MAKVPLGYDTGDRLPQSALMRAWPRVVALVRMAMNPAHVMGVDATRFLRVALAVRSAHARVYSEMIFAGHTGAGDGGARRTGFLSVGPRANWGMGGTGGGGAAMVGLGGGEW